MSSSSYEKSVKNAAKRAGYDPTKLERASPKSGKKWKYNVPDGRVVRFGQRGYEDYHTHRDNERRRAYMARSGGIGGNWARDKYSANNLARNILWPEKL